MTDGDHRPWCSVSSEKTCKNAGEVVFSDKNERGTGRWPSLNEARFGGKEAASGWKV